MHKISWTAGFAQKVLASVFILGGLLSPLERGTVAAQREPNGAKHQ
jgi:hypothetical protein